MSEINELAAAVERLRNDKGCNYSFPIAHWEHGNAIDQARKIVVDAVLPEFDETPVDEAWLRSICGSYEYDNDNSVAFYLVRQLSGDNLLSLCVSNSSGRFSCSLAKLCDGPMKDSPWIDLEVVGTRGELLSLCRALGIQLGEGT